jgi:CHAT domain-containing protein/tetratricopeptide (TPR) repeat protein
MLLRYAAGEIKIEESNEKLNTPGAISFERSHEGEKWQVGNGAPNLAGPSRTLGGNAPASEVVSVAATAISMDQLLGQSVFRGKSFLTPAPNSRLLSGAFTIRRIVDGDSQLNADQIEIVSGNRVVLSFTFPKDKDTIAWSDIDGKPAELAAGLRPGEYSIRVAGQAGTSFVIEDKETFDWVMEPIDSFTELVGEDSPSQLVYSVEYLLSQLDDDGRPSPYYCDALDLLESSGMKSEFARSRRELILKSLGKNTELPADPSQTGIAEIDSLRAMIRDGRWTKAKEEATKLAESNDQRTAGLAKLYLAVIVGESSIASVYVDDPAAEAFMAAIAAIGQQNPTDAFRAYNNFANYLSGKVQSRIYNYSLQSATELDNPLLTSLYMWNAARNYYAAAAQLAASMSKSDQAAAAINHARHYVVMGDFVRNLRSDDEYSLGLIKTSDDIAKMLATNAVELAVDEPNTRGAALEVLGHIAYRRGDTQTAGQRATEALKAYEQAGSLAGIESCHRTLGLIVSQDSAQAEQAINHFEVTLQISELLRQQIELSDAGADRAGFFARHAYTNERLIDLLVQKGDVHRALEVAEMAKARSFQDMLSQHSAGDDADDEADFLTLKDVLAEWPADSCAIEFFIGSRYAYAFCILPDGEISAHRLTGADGQPLAAGELVGRITEFLTSMVLRAEKMYGEAVSGRGFDKTWQDKLHQFYLELIPDEFRKSIDHCERLVVIPHHVLHYFPFAALVVEPDRTPRGKMELPQPNFLIERSIDITIAPSLLSYFQLTQLPSEVSQMNAVGIADFENAPRLPGVEMDLKNFKEVFGDAVGTIVQKNPILEPDIARVFGEPGLLLIGTHGQNEADRPLASFLLCNSGGNFDGRLTALELFNLPIESDVVVLSACYSGLADRSPLPGDDLFGLQRAILQSGAKSVVSGLWDVYDDTAPELVKSTMTNFNGGQTISRSLAEAQREFLKTRKEAGPSDPWVHPYFWAVYTCSGGGHSKVASR